MTIRVGILTVSDRCARGKQEDRAGAALEEAVVGCGWRVVERAVVADETDDIAERLRAWADGEGMDLILTTGGTGITRRDVTPDATRAIIDREVPGLAEAMRSESRTATPGAMLSRARAGTRGAVLIVNLPGSPRGAVECFSTIADALPHAVNLLTDPEHARHPGTHLAPPQSRVYNPPPPDTPGQL